VAIRPPSPHAAPVGAVAARSVSATRNRRLRRPVVAAALSVAAALLLAACGSTQDPDEPIDPDAAVEDPDDGTEVEDPADGDGSDSGDADADPADGDEEEGDAATSDDEDAAPAGPPVDPAEVGANELGVVPVLMYHQLREDGGSVYDMTAEEFRSELTWLFDNGYRPITTAQLARGEIDVPAGTKPVVLTFDDSTSSQAQLTPDGELDPETSLGILVELASGYDDVEPRASVYVISGSLFGGTAAGEQVPEVLHRHGMEIGNHTHTHPNLSSLSDAAVQDELATNVAVMTDLVAGAEVVTLSLPLGVAPANRALAERGSAPAGSYEHVGVLLVGANPAPSPFSASFDAMAIPRIRANVDPDAELESTWWLEVIESGGTNAPFVSDGDPATISFPAELADRLDPAFADRANPY
jgi:peptidoglycan/xylan/chitin deacetylase (PgdA/CDA1 family)